MIGLLKIPAKWLFRALGYVPVRMDGERFRGDPYHVGFWNEVNRGRWEPSTLEALREFLTKDSTFVDVGAWIGPTAMFAARRAHRVFCLEPDPFAYECLKRNLARNGLDNVRAFPLALAAESGSRLLTVPDGQLGNSRATLLHRSEEGVTVEVKGIGWDEWRRQNDVGRVDFLKVDIEGGEFEILPSMKDYLESERPVLHLSLHAPYLDWSEREGELRKMAELVRPYSKCYDDSRNPVDTQDLVARSREVFTSFLFLP